MFRYQVKYLLLDLVVNFNNPLFIFEYSVHWYREAILMQVEVGETYDIRWAGIPICSLSFNKQQQTKWYFEHKNFDDDDVEI